MRYLALAADYDGTLAHHGVVDEPTLAALERLRASGRALILVTGRVMDELRTVCPRLDLFDRIVGENGALIHDPATGAERLLGAPPPATLRDELAARGVEDILVGRVIVAGWKPAEAAARETIRALGLDLQVILNKNSLMLLPTGIDKATGLAAALAELGLAAERVVAVGDAENDLPLFRHCGYAVAVANSLPAVKDQADRVTTADHGAGVVELIDALLADDLPPARSP
jgi:hydroxymethylpyrimidine pyrophosphatase-like HAD family hydrolase